MSDMSHLLDPTGLPVVITRYLDAPRPVTCGVSSGSVAAALPGTRWKDSPKCGARRLPLSA